MAWRSTLCEICVAWASTTVYSETIGCVLRGQGVYGKCSKCGPGPGPGLSAIGSDQSCHLGHVCGDVWCCAARPAHNHAYGRCVQKAAAEVRPNGRRHGRSRRKAPARATWCCSVGQEGPGDADPSGSGCWHPGRGTKRGGPSDGNGLGAGAGVLGAPLETAERSWDKWVAESGTVIQRYPTEVQVLTAVLHVADVALVSARMSRAARDSAEPAARKEACATTWPRWATICGRASTRPLRSSRRSSRSSFG